MYKLYKRGASAPGIIVSNIRARSDEILVEFIPRKMKGEPKFYNSSFKQFTKTNRLRLGKILLTEKAWK